MNEVGLPTSFDQVELGEWKKRGGPEARESGEVADTAVMLVYSRLGAHVYDEIAERVAAAVPPDPSTGLMGRRTTRASNERARRSRRPPELEAVRIEQNLLTHRPLELPVTDGRMQYSVDTDTITIRTSDSPIDWRFALAYPPAALATHLRSNDSPRPLAWRISAAMPGLCWLPFDALLRHGRFDRCQELRDELVDLVEYGSLPLFVSHRWLTTGEPDPNGRQARLLAWQLLAALCEAVHVARARGLHEPLQLSDLLGFRLGVGGADLAEAIIVAVLRTNLDDEQLATASAEARAIEDTLGTALVERADVDTDLLELKDLLDKHPTLAALAARLHLWIDFCCLPQPPRTEAEQSEFKAGLGLLQAAQMLGRTVVLLDEVDEYTSRAWCLLEVLTADRFMGTFDVVSGLPENTDPEGTPYRHLSDLLMDLPHVLWRAMLDVEVFGRFGWEEALARLELSVTDAADLPYICDRLRSTPGPNRIHTGAGDLVTGIFPLPQSDDGLLVLPDQAGRPAEVPARAARGVIGDEVLTLASRGPIDATSPVAEPSLVPLATWDPTDGPTEERPHAHVAVVGACEGEAVLIADWVDANLAEIEDKFGVETVSRSWIADDVAPVGGMPFGGLAVAPVSAPNWIVATLLSRREHCTVTGMLATAARRAGVGLAWICVDTGELATEGEFPRRRAEPTAEAERYAPTSDEFAAVLGGVYRKDLAPFIFGRHDTDESDDD